MITYAIPNFFNIELFIIMKMNSALNNLQMLIRCKTQRNKQTKGAIRLFNSTSTHIDYKDRQCADNVVRTLILFAD